jgi:hypothetical protein
VKFFREEAFVVGSEIELRGIVVDGADFWRMHEIVTLNSMKEMKDACTSVSNMNEFG